MFSLRRVALRAASLSSSAIGSSSKPVVRSSLLAHRPNFSASLPVFAVRKYSDYGSEYPGSGGSDFNSSNSGGDFNTSRPSGGARPFSAPVDLSPNPSIYVGNLVFDLTAEDLKREFSPFGPIKNVQLATDARGLSKGFGYVEFETTEQAEAAIEAKNQNTLEGRRLIVNFQAKSRRQNTENPPSNTLFIGNLAFEMTDADLNGLFREVRNCLDIRIAVDRRTGQPRGFAHADFLSVEDATVAKNYLQDREIFGRKLRLDYSTGVKNPGANSATNRS